MYRQRPPYHHDPLVRLRLQRQVQHLYRLGARATFEAFVEIAERIGGGPAISEVLAEYERCSPELLRAVGGDKFPKPPLHLVPKR